MQNFSYMVQLAKYEAMIHKKVKDPMSIKNTVDLSKLRKK